MSRTVFAPKRVGENRSYSVDFISQLRDNDTVIGLVVTASVYSGVDATPANILSGGTAIFNGRIGSQSITGGVEGTIYTLVFQATTTAGDVIQIVGQLAIIPNQP